LALSLFNSITKNIFCFFTPGLPPQSEAGGNVVIVFVIVLGVRLRILPAVCIDKAGRIAVIARFVVPHRALGLKMWIEEIMGTS